MPEFNSTIDIREAVYEEWYRKRMKAAKEQQKEKQRKEEEEARKKKEVGSLDILSFFSPIFFFFK